MILSRMKIGKSLFLKAFEKHVANEKKKEEEKKSGSRIYSREDEGLNGNDEGSTRRIISTV